MLTFHVLCAGCNARIEPLSRAETVETPSRADTELCRQCYGIERDFVANRDHPDSSLRRQNE